VKQSVLTITADVDAAHVEDVRAAIAQIDDDPGSNALLSFSDFDSLHFASLFLAEGGSITTPKIILECNVDGSLDAWLDTLAAGGAKGLDALFGGSPGYPAGAEAADRRSWLKSHVVLPGAYHIGATGRSLERIRQEAQLRQAIEDFLESEDEAGRLAGATPAAVRQAIQEHVRADPSLSWAQVAPGPNETRGEILAHRAKAAASVLVVVLLLPVLIPVLVVTVPVLLLKEYFDAVQKGPATAEHIRAIEEREDQLRVAQNHLVCVIPLKRGIMRPILLRTVLYAINQVARVTGVHGELGGIPSIHFAHWSLINGGKHLLFVSNFDGSWESYLGDFVDKASKGLTGIWSNTVKFPRTVLLVYRGAADGPRFLEWARANQSPTGAWYTAYPAATMATIDNDSALRKDLFTELDAEEAAAWLARL
jgi:hypothetical protein